MTKKRFEICPASELKSGERVIERLDRFSVGVFNVDGDYYAIKNDCPHQRAPLCKGKLTGTTVSETPGEYDWDRDGQILQCPWHGWEFDVKSGESVFNPHQVKAKTFQTTVEPADTRTDGSGKDSQGVCSGCGTTADGDDPSVETYDVEVEHGTVVVYL